MKRDKTSLRRGLPRIALLLLMLAVAAEGVLRAASQPRAGEDLPVMQTIKAQDAAGAFTYAPDPYFGALMAPGTSRTVETPEFTYRLQTDHAGFPNREPWPQAVDVAVLGDSLLAGAGVGYDGAFTTILERELAGGNVLNFAVPGGGTEHELRVYRKFVQPLRPTLVVAMLWLNWDIDNTLHFERWLAEKPPMDYTRYRMGFRANHPARDAHAQPVATETRRTARSLFSRSRLLHEIDEFYDALAARSGPVERVQLPDGSTVLLSTRLQARLAQGFERPALPEIDEVFFRPLMQLQREVQAGGGRLVVVLVPSKEELYAADAFPAVLRPWHEAKAALESRGLPTLDLYPVFRGLDPQTPPYFHVDSHLNAYGNRLVAVTLASWIREQGILRPKG